MKLPTKTLERNLFKSGYGLIYAVDEVGMGCLAGPVVVCAVAMTSQFYKKAHKKLCWLRDSKLLLAKQRERFANELLSMLNIGCLTKVAYCRPKTIDKMNIYQASRLAMRSAIKKMNNELRIKDNGSENHNSKVIVLVDGPHKIAGLKIHQMSVIRGDRKDFAI